MTITPTKIAVGVVLAAALIPTLAFATDKAAYCRGQAGYTATALLRTGTLAQMLSYGDCQANFRTTDLAAATTRLSQMQHLSATTLASLEQKVTNTTSAVGSVKATLDAETATTSALVDLHAMNTSVRVYALVLPQVWITAAGDREITVGGLLTQVQTTLQSALNATTTSGAATLQADLNDMGAKISDANMQATNAENGVVNLVPDNGATSTMASNKAAIVAARASVGVGQTDLQTARQDAQVVSQALGL